jgi:hypothetical protein
VRTEVVARADDDEALRPGEPLELDADRLPHGAATAVGADEPRPEGSTLAAISSRRHPSASCATSTTRAEAHCAGAASPVEEGVASVLLR